MENRSRRQRVPPQMGKFDTNAGVSVKKPADKAGIAAERRYYAWLATAILVMAFAGFTRTYFLVPYLGLPEGNLPYTPLVHLHAAISFAWCILLLIQSCLVASAQIRAHQRLGIGGAALYCALVVLGPFVAVRSTLRYGATPDELAFLAVSTGNIIAYTVLLGAAILWRRRPDIHKRLMLLGMVALLSAPFGRLVELPFLLEHVVGPGFVVLALAWWDFKSRGRLHTVTLFGGPAILLWELLPNAYMNSGWWLATARWLVRAFPV